VFNARHGLRFTRMDMERAIRTLLRVSPDSSDRCIAGLLGCDHKTVGSMRRSMFPKPLAHPSRVAVAQGRSAHSFTPNERHTSMRHLSRELDRASRVNFGDVLITVGDWWRARHPRCRVTFETTRVHATGGHVTLLPRVPHRDFPMRRPGKGVDPKYQRRVAKLEAAAAELERELGPFDLQQGIAVMRILERLVGL
jgi:hypothetical protein